jgi:hypothetical protein
MRFVLQSAALLAVLAAVTALALAGGAPSLGVALGFGQIAFMVALVALLLRS